MCQCLNSNYPSSFRLEELIKGSIKMGKNGKSLNQQWFNAKKETNQENNKDKNDKNTSEILIQWGTNFCLVYK